jgi:hypothetical protein
MPDRLSRRRREPRYLDWRPLWPLAPNPDSVVLGRCRTSGDRRGGAEISKILRRPPGRARVPWPIGVTGRPQSATLAPDPRREPAQARRKFGRKGISRRSFVTAVPRQPSDPPHPAPCSQSSGGPGEQEQPLRRRTHIGPLDPDVLLGDRAVAPLGDGHHAAPVFELADDAGPLAGPERDWVRHDLWRRAPD